jgi:SAM-dependent methyltransferase
MDIQCGYGFDVAVTRADDLDKRMVQGVQKRQLPRALDIGCGGGGQSVRLATAGASVLSVDVMDYTAVFAASRTAHGLPEGVLSFVQSDLRSLGDVLDSRRFDLICLQRTLHYVQYSTAVEVLRSLRTYISTGGTLYISVTGIESDIGLHYDDAQKKVSDRFCQLCEADASTFHITEPVCLYTPEEFVVLLQEGGWEIEECWVSAFGNIKAICR